MLNIGDILDKKYEVIKILGKGGMGVVYLCKNTRFGNFWAIKEIIKDVKNTGILTEANILKGLNHVGIRRIVDIFYENNNLYMVQDYVEGQTLKEYVKVNGKIKIEKICRITSDLCDIVAYLHNQNPAIIYRDIKPSNIIITSSGKIVLIDFGISKVYKSDTDEDTVRAGSNGYAAPEQYGLGKCCKQTDIYGIGMLIYFMVKGRTPFTGVEPLMDENYEIDIDDKLKKIIQTCVKINIYDRYISVEALKKEILEVLKVDKYEKTAILQDTYIGKNIFNKKTKGEIINKGKTKKIIVGLLYFIVVILVIIYISYGNINERVGLGTPEIRSPIVGSSSIEQEAILESNPAPINETIIVPSKDNTTAVTQASTINKKTLLSNQKAKVREKKKHKQK